MEQPSVNSVGTQEQRCTSSAPPRRLTFPEALTAIKLGQRATRAGWHGSNMVVELQVPDENSKMTLPYLYITLPAKEGVVPWTISQTDALAEDWMIV